MSDFTIGYQVLILKVTKNKSLVIRSASVSNKTTEDDPKKKKKLNELMINCSSFGIHKGLLFKAAVSKCPPHLRSMEFHQQIKHLHK